MAAAPAKKEKPAPGPDDLVRESAGVYRTGDGRFEVQKSDVGWYLVDTQQANEFGQQLIHGPMPTLEAIRDAIPGARDLKPLLRVRPKKAKPAKESPPPAPPPSWIDRLPPKEAAEVRRMIRALEQDGLKGAEELVRRHRDDTSPTIATRIVEHRLAKLIDDTPEDKREATRRVVERVVDELTISGTATERPLPRWALVEIELEADATHRRIRPKLPGS
jgi:hypothetical protein